MIVHSPFTIQQTSLSPRIYCETEEMFAVAARSGSRHHVLRVSRLSLVVDLGSRNMSLVVKVHALTTSSNFAPGSGSTRDIGSDVACLEVEILLQIYKIPQKVVVAVPAIVRH